MHPILAFFNVNVNVNINVIYVYVFIGAAGRETVGHPKKPYFGNGTGGYSWQKAVGITKTMLSASIRHA